MYQRLVTLPVIEPVTLEEVKLHLRIDGNEDGNEEDSLLSALITAARQKAEEYTRRAFITQTWEYAIVSVDKMLCLPRPPIQAINEVTLDGEIVSTENYSLIGKNAFYSKIPLQAVNPDGLVIRYISGYGSNATDIPQAIRQAILMLITHLYEHRGDEKVEIPTTIKALLQPYRVMLI